MTSERDLEALAAKVGVFYHDGKVNLGAPLYAFTPTELRELARRLQPARVPDGGLDREYVERVHAKSRNWQGQISVNASVLAELCHTYLAAAPAQQQGGEDHRHLQAPTGVTREELYEDALLDAKKKSARRQGEENGNG